MMANFRIIETGSETPDVLIRRDFQNEDALNNSFIVKIETCGYDNELLSHCWEDVLFENEVSASEYIDQYRQKNAESFCKRQGVTYNPTKQ